jgi:hypothetical protein
MRRVCLVFAALLFAQMAAPRRAEAWFGWLDQLSGPGKFYGFQVDMRLKCFGARSTPTGVESLGFKLSFCDEKKDRDRLFSIDLNERFFWTIDHPSVNDLKVFADGHILFLLTAVPSISYRPIYHLVRDLSADDKRRYLDVVDVGAGFGGYLFASKGINDFTGLTGDVSLDFHAPAILVSKLIRKNAAWNLLPQVRYSRVAFPAGFEANAFNPVLPANFAGVPFVPSPANDKSRALPGPEWTGSWTFFIEARIGR